MASWELFPDLSENEQVRFLLDKATRAWAELDNFDEQKTVVEKYLLQGREVLDGDLESVSSLIKFLNDPDMTSDFAAIYEQIRGAEKAEAALDLASYACGFICNISAANARINQLPDPVLESVPEVYPYFRKKAEILNLED